MAIADLNYFVCMGVQKAGTSSLHALLARHPQLLLPVQKETKYFLRVAEPDYDDYFAMLSRGRNDGGATAFGEVDPEYLFVPGVDSKIAQFRPDARIIILLRDPIARAYSHYWMIRKRGQERLEFAEALEAEPARISRSLDDLVRFSYLARGRYVEQLHRLFAHFPQPQVLILPSALFRSDPSAFVASVLSHIGVSLQDGLEMSVEEHPGRVARSETISRVLHSDARWKRAAKAMTGNPAWLRAAAGRVKRAAASDKPPPPISSSDRQFAEHLLGDANAGLEDLAGWGVAERQAYRREGAGARGDSGQ